MVSPLDMSKDVLLRNCVKHTVIRSLYLGGGLEHEFYFSIYWE